MLTEIERVMTPAGVCYFAGPNKYELVEPHYGLPFLGWLPLTVASFYLRVTGKGENYTETPYSYPALMRLLSEFEITDYTQKILADPVYYKATDLVTPGSFKQLLAKIVFKLAPFVFPSFVFVLRKRAPQTANGGAAVEVHGTHALPVADRSSTGPDLIRTRAKTEPREKTQTMLTTRPIADAIKPALKG